VRLNKNVQSVDPTRAQLKALHACIKKVTEDLEGLRFNTAIAAMMIFINEATTWENRPTSVLAQFLILLQPFAPHLAEELWSKLMVALPKSAAQPALALSYQPWPLFDAQLLVEENLEIPVHVNGKLRDRIIMASEATEEQIRAAALAAEKVKPFLEGKTIKKVILVGKKLVNIAVA